jgi:hypothetical protein
MTTTMITVHKEAKCGINALIITLNPNKHPLKDFIYGKDKINKKIVAYD